MADSSRTDNGSTKQTSGPRAFIDPSCLNDHAINPCILYINYVLFYILLGASMNNILSIPRSNVIKLSSF